MSSSWKAARHRHRHLLLLLLLLLLAGLVGGTYFVLNSSWLQENVETDTLHLIHVVWGMGVAFLMSASAGWLYLRRSIHPFSESVASAAELPDRTREFRRYALWFVQLRWLAVVLVGILSFLGTQVLELLDEDLFLPLGVITLLLLSSNIVFLRVSKSSGNPYRVILLQTVSDLFLLTLLLHFSGGIENSLYAIYVFHVVIAATLLTSRDSYLITTAVSVLLAVVAFGEYSELLPHYAIQLTPHEHGETLEHGAHIAHPAHDMTFVLGRLLPFLGILYCLTYLTQIVVVHLRRREQQLLGALKERELMEAQLVQTGKMAAIGELAGNFAHEVNNPVAIISGKAKLLLDEYGDGELPSPVAEDLRKIDLHAERIGRITKGLLAFSRPSLGKKEHLDLNEVVRTTLELFDDHLREAGISLESRLAPALPRVLANQNELQQVFFNILNNAIDAMVKGGVLQVATRARIAHASEGRNVPTAQAFISDTGPGMEEEMLEKIFEPFFTTKEEGKGTGLGLSISQGLIRSHKGWIEVRSVMGKGTTFAVVLPVSEEKFESGEWSDAGVQGPDPR